MRRILLPLILITLLLGACAKDKAFRTSDEKLAAANELYARKKFSRAAELYGDVYFERSSANVAYALMRQADSYFAINKFTDARLAYEEFIEAFPQNADVPTAAFRIGLCLWEESLPAQYDQTETLACINSFRTFMQKYPRDERYQTALEYIRKAQYKLIEKTYLNGYIYYKMKDYSAALMYFNEVLDLGNTDRLDRQSHYYAGLLHLKQGNPDLARTHYDRMVEKYPGAKETKKLARHFKTK